ncbi:hypothetical protein IWX78_001335 [Mycetocola sp. CAN_C7]|uniref:WhiB family transcriptional regulator n=1 Tax=Mycetocola sp. CAN_C7 TaxID=2787724 RepID=UPI0018CB1850
MSAASSAYTALHNAMHATTPECHDDGRFILDDQPIESLAYICQRCPLFDLCATYAQLERPTGGIWAGKRYRTIKKEN